MVFGASLPFRTVGVFVEEGGIIRYLIVSLWLFPVGRITSLTLVASCPDKDAPLTTFRLSRSIPDKIEINPKPVSIGVEFRMPAIKASETNTNSGCIAKTK